MRTGKSDQVLEFVAGHPGCAAGDIAQALALTTSAIYTAVMRLCDRGLLAFSGRKPRRYRLAGGEDPVEVAPVRMRACAAPCWRPTGTRIELAGRVEVLAIDGPRLARSEMAGDYGRRGRRPGPRSFRFNPGKFR